MTKCFFSSPSLHIRPSLHINHPTFCQSPVSPSHFCCFKKRNVHQLPQPQIGCLSKNLWLGIISKSHKWWVRITPLTDHPFFPCLQRIFPAGPASLVLTRCLIPPQSHDLQYLELLRDPRPPLDGRMWRNSMIQQGIKVQDMQPISARAGERSLLHCITRWASSITAALIASCFSSV